MQKEKFEKSQQDDKDFDEYFTNLSSNEHWRPSGRFNARMFAAAEAAVIGGKMKNVEFQNALMTQNRMKIAEQHRVISSYINAAGVSLKGKDYGNALANYEKAYEAHKDGADLVIGKDQKSYSVKMRNGSEMNRNFNSTQEMLDHFRVEAEKFLPPENFAKTWIAEFEERSNENYRLAQEDKLYQNKDGLRGRAGRRVDPTTGKEKNVYEVWGAGGVREVDADEWRSLKMMSQEERKTEAEISASKSLGVQRRTKAEPKPKDMVTVNDKLYTKANYAALVKEAKSLSDRVFENVSPEQYDRLKDMSKSKMFKAALKQAQNNPAAMEKLKRIFEENGIPVELADAAEDIVSHFSRYKPHRSDSKR